MKFYNGRTFEEMSRYVFTKKYGNYSNHLDENTKKIKFEDAFIAESPYSSEIYGKIDLFIFDNGLDLILAYDTSLDDI